MRLSFLLSVFVLTLPLAAENGEAARIAALVAQLGDDDVAVRQAAERELTAAAAEHHRALEQALEAATDPEARARLSRILLARVRPAWLRDPGIARAEAAKRGRPILVICAAGEPDAPVNPSAWKFIHVTLQDKAFVKSLNESFVLLWHDLYAACGGETAYDVRLDGEFPEEELVLCDEGSDQMMLNMLICHPDGGVRHAVCGWWPADLLRAECGKAATWALGTQEDAARAREGALARLHADIAELAASGAGDPSVEHQVGVLKTLTRRYASYAGSKVGLALDAALAEADEDFRGRELRESGDIVLEGEIQEGPAPDGEPAK